jgi:FtsP/CotA-like multicopper oxidase with cupredoxin domain
MWNEMRMADSDLSDVTGAAYTFLMNGKAPADGWVGEFNKGDKILLRIINGSAMTFFDVRIPGLKMTVVASDGQYIQPVTVDEFRIGVAETYDVIVEPSSEQAYTLFCQTIDRSGFARGTLTPDVALVANIPEMDESPLLTYADMGMNHGAPDACTPEHAALGHCTIKGPSSSKEGHAGHGGIKKMAIMEAKKNICTEEHAAMGHCEMPKTTTAQNSCTPEHAAMGHCEMPKAAVQNNCTAEHAAMGHCTMDATPSKIIQYFSSGIEYGTGMAGFGSAKPISYDNVKMGPQIDMLAEGAQYRLDDPGVGLRNNGRKVLTYADIFNLNKTPDPREPSREIELHLTGNMSRYMWSMDGVKASKADPIHLKFGERVRITLVNDTMMNHPFHLHGVWSDLETGDANYIPRKHTIIVQPGAKISYLVTADARGKWAYHCHLLYHMLGMFREVHIS